MKRSRNSAQIHHSAKICASAVIGKQFRPALAGSPSYKVSQKAIIEERVYVGEYATIGAGSVVGKGAIIDDFSIVECEVEIGKRTLLIYRAHVCNGAFVGHDCVVGGFIGENTVVGNYCRIFGTIAHAQYNPLLKWDGKHSEEKAPTFDDLSFVGFGAVVAGGVHIGYKAYIMAGTIVTKDVPSFHIVSGVNRMVHYSNWRGTLSQSPFFLEGK
ncbi:MAG: hypothetical protein ABSA47_09620 [Verrucomicrobiota bacterium]|jgi:acetyltransferase-like isoleucine patch superfamily enzyme